MWPEVDRNLEEFLNYTGDNQTEVVTPAEINVMAMKTLQAFSKVLTKIRQLKLEEKKIISIRDNLANQIYKELAEIYTQKGGKSPTRASAEIIAANRMNEQINQLSEIRAQLEYLDSMVHQLQAVQAGLTQMNIANSHDVKLCGK